MTVERIEEIYASFKNVLGRLEEAIGEDVSASSVILDGTIQRFEFTFELSWKLLKETLLYAGIDASTPRSVIKEAFAAGMIKDGDGWIDMLGDRNKTSHIYDEKQAMEIYSKIKSRHLLLFKNLDKIILDKIR